MKLTKPERLALYALGQFYASLNQPLLDKNLRLRTSKITFIELLLSYEGISKQTRAVYKNLESLEKKKLIAYENRMVRFTKNGLLEFRKIGKEVREFVEIKKHFKDKRSARILQTIIGS
jgi:hypothetical protein